jgi:GT2 family glycosyltransferase
MSLEILMKLTMGDDPRIVVDIVVNNFNYGRFLTAAIDSALGQRGVDVHVIVVDDGSTDGSRDVIASYGDRVTVVLQENRGQASALNAGFLRHRGDVVIFLDADDVLVPDAAAQVTAAFAGNPEAVKVHYRMAVIDADGKPTGQLRPPPHLRLPSGAMEREELSFPFDLPWTATSGNAFAAPALDRLLPIPEQEFRHAADWYLNHLAALVGPVAAVETICAGYRVHGANSYAPSGSRLQLEQVRKSVRYAAATRRELRRAAPALGHQLRSGPVLSVADLANRLISLRLAPAAHPLPRDRVSRLVLGGCAAAARRFDVRWPTKLMFVGWFFAMALVPRRPGAQLAEVFLFAERRSTLNSLLVRLRTRAAGRRGGRGR